MEVRIPVTLVMSVVVAAMGARRSDRPFRARVKCKQPIDVQDENMFTVWAQMLIHSDGGHEHVNDLSCRTKANGANIATY